MDDNVAGKRSELHEFKFQLQGLLSTLQKLPSGEQRAALNLLQSSVDKQVSIANGITQAADIPQATVIPETGTENHKSIQEVTRQNTDVPGSVSKGTDKSLSGEHTSHTECSGNYKALHCISSDGLSWPSGNELSEAGLSRMQSCIKSEEIFQSDNDESVSFDDRIETSTSVIYIKEEKIETSTSVVDIKNEMLEECNSNELLNSNLERDNTKDQGSFSASLNTSAISVNTETISNSDLDHHDSVPEVLSHIGSTRDDSGSPKSVSKSSKTKKSCRKKHNAPASTRPRKSTGDVNNVCDALAHEIHRLGGHAQEGALEKELPETTAALQTPTITTTYQAPGKSLQKEPSDSFTAPAQPLQCDSYLSCNICNAKFILLNNFKRHMEGHKRNDCSKCPERFSSHKGLKAHMKAKHNVDICAKLYPCEFCQRTFKKRVSLYYHLKVHASQSQVVCQKCGKFCEDGNEFNNHMADHIKGTNFKCHICSEIFVRRQQYDEHMKGHKKNICEMCDKSFSNKRELIKHCRGEHQSLPQNITLDKEYKCEKCDHVFNRPSLLKHHLLLHNGIKPVACQLCNKHFSHRRGLRKHLNSFLHEQTLSTSSQAGPQLRLPT